MSASLAKAMIVDCGSMTGGRRQRELELPSEAVPFFGVAPSGSHTALYMPLLLSSGQSELVRMIYRKNSMWRIEFTASVLELGSLIPKGSRRSNHAALFEKVGSKKTARYKLTFHKIGSPSYKAEFAKAVVKARTIKGRAGARDFGWY